MEVWCDRIHETKNILFSVLIMKTRKLICSGRRCVALLFCRQSNGQNIYVLWFGFSFHFISCWTNRTVWSRLKARLARLRTDSVTVCQNDENINSWQHKLQIPKEWGMKWSWQNYDENATLNSMCLYLCTAKSLSIIARLAFCSKNIIIHSFGPQFEIHCLFNKLRRLKKKRIFASFNFIFPVISGQISREQLFNRSALCSVRELWHFYSHSYL